MVSESPDIEWIFHGSIVVPTGNPFTQNPADKNDEAPKDSESVQWLGPCLKILLDHVLVVDRLGVIRHMAPFGDTVPFDASRFAQVNDPRFIRLDEHEFLCPGFVDLHIHAPQYSYTGTATDRPLMGPNGWLETYTFPSERRLGTDLDHARHVYEKLVRTTLDAGTTTAVYFGTLHLEPCKILVDLTHEMGQRSFVGKVCMDRNSPDDYIQTLQENVQETRELIEYIRNKAAGELEESVPIEANATIQDLPLVFPIITPRFIPTCTPQLMKALGELAAEYNCHIQSHISESIDEVAFSRHLDASEDNGGGRTDAEIFDSHGLLTDRCIMAHAVHLTETDMDLMKERGSGIAHCPLSNFFFAGGSLPCRKLLERGNKVGLGTDVAGGYSPSMMHSSCMAVVASRSLEHGALQNNMQDTSSSTKEDHPVILDYREAFYLATLGGAEALGLQNQIGSFGILKEFDAVLLSATVETCRIHLFDTDTKKDVFQKLCTLGDDRNVKHVFVKGKKVK